MSSPVIDLSPHGKRQAFLDTIIYAEDKHAGKKRLRGGREEICHPLELTAIQTVFAEIMQARRQKKSFERFIDFVFFTAAWEVAKRAVEISRMKKKPLIQMVLDGVMSPWVDELEMVRRTGLLTHDTVESQLKKVRKDHLLDKELYKLLKTTADDMYRQIDEKFPGGGRIADRLTDEWDDRLGEKRWLQRNWGESVPQNWFDFDARSCKTIDDIGNLADNHRIPHINRSLKKRQQIAEDMYGWVRWARGAHPVLKMAFFILYIRYAEENGLSDNAVVRGIRWGQAYVNYIWAAGEHAILARKHAYRRYVPPQPA